MKPAYDSKLEEDAQRALIECLGAVPCLGVEKVLRRERIKFGSQTDLVDLCVHLRLPQSEQKVIAEFKMKGEPSTARAAANQLYRYKANWPGSYGVFIAPYVSPAAAEVCRQEGIGYVDLAGNCRLAFDCVYIERTGNANSAAAKRDLRTLYSPKAERVLRVLLTEPKCGWQVQHLAREAQVSIGLASNVKKLLDGREWLTKGERNAAFTLREPGALLTEWAHNARPERSKGTQFYSLQTLPDMECNLAEVCRQEQIPYALSGLSGAARYAPYTRYQRAAAYVSGNIQELAKRLQWKPVASGANVTLLTPYDDGVYYGVREVEGVQIASPLQVYLDLQGAKGRSDEAATFLREEVIEPTWK